MNEDWEVIKIAKRKALELEIKALKKSVIIFKKLLVKQSLKK